MIDKQPDKPERNSKTGPAFDYLADNCLPQLAWNAGTIKEHETWRTALHAKVLELIGSMPDPVPLEVERAEEKEFEKYTRHKIYIQSQENYWVPAYYFMPKEIKGKRPAVVCFHGHSGIIPYITESPEPVTGEPRNTHDYAPFFAEKGYITIAPVIRGWNETCEERDMGFEHDRSCYRVTMNANLLGMTPVGLRCWDGMRLIDFCKEQPEIDSEQIGVGGLSGGGMLSLFMPILDDRVKLTMIGGWFSSLRASIFSVRHCPCNVIPGIMNWCEMSDIAALIAPRPVLLINGINDPIFPIKEAREGLKKLEAVYALLGKSENIEADFFEGGHEWSNRKTLGFLEKHFGT